ncbi:hypothetical protein [Uliginosibacterium sediminicola]|uniref:SMODS and SLOG-associating 2TM effector domain-containing protein n=1 Tax=Uliginosibacterium sediminicola TaxID=2024550 RepID=A0ABU9Z449_9RHOO
MSQHIVDANYRFIAAYQEVNARITQRQQVLTLYVSIVLSLLAALVALRPSTGAQEAPVEWLILGFPVASICLAFLNYKAERAITNLRRFLSSMERLGNAHHALPSYNTDPQWASGANKARRFHDYAAAVLAAGGNAAGLGAALAIYPQRFAEAPLFLYAASLLALVSLIVLLLTPRWGYTPEL